MTVRLEWHGDELETAILDAGNTAVGAAAATLAGEATKNMGSEGGGPYERRVSAKTGREYHVGPGAPPGSFPGIRSGQLRQRITSTRGKSLRAEVGVNLPRGLALERGTSRMAARPWLLRSARESQGKLVKAFTTVLRRQLRSKLGVGDA